MKTLKITKINTLEKNSESYLVLVTSEGKKFFARACKNEQNISRVEIYWDGLNKGTYRNVEIYGAAVRFGTKSPASIQTTSYGSLEAEDFSMLLEANKAALEIVTEINE